MTLKAEWLNYAIELSKEKSDFYSGYRKIQSARMLTFTGLDKSLQLADAGYTKMKLSGLVRHYFHKESHHAAVQLWARRRTQESYGSVGFTCYNHFIKGGSIDAKRAKKASVFGPCIQSVVITWLNRTSYSVDIFYRTTEFYKKFPADLILLRDILLDGFDFKGMELVKVNCHFANISMHPMYAVTLLGQLNKPIEYLERLKIKDNDFFLKTVRWTIHYICPEYYKRIANYSQAKRVYLHAQKMFDKQTMKALQKFLRANHPKHNSKMEEDDDVSE